MALYEELKGGNGAEIRFRAPRRKAIELFGDKGPEVQVNGTVHRVHDLSRSGLAVLDRDHHYTEHDALNDRLVPIQMGTDNLTLHSGYGRIIRVDKFGTTSIVGIQFTDRSADLKKISSEYRAHTTRAALRDNKRSAICRVPRRYRLICFDALELLKRQKQILDSFERQNFDAPDQAAQSQSMLDDATREFEGDWVELTFAANAELNQFMTDPVLRQHAKDFTEATITPELRAGAIWDRTYAKPLGYPGDFRVMNYVYDGRDVGETLYDRFVHRLGLRMLRCVKFRKVEAQKIIKQELEKWVPRCGKSLQITNLACGGAEEINEVLQHDRSKFPVNLTFVDQDEKALLFAYERLHPRTVAEGSHITTQWLHSSFTDLMKGGPLSGKLPPQDLIYSLGLFDYLRAPRAKKLIATLYDSVRPGGRLLIGNLANGNIADLWSAEFICDWSMVYRSTEQMAGLANSLAGRADFDPNLVETWHDSNKEVVLLSVRKPS